MPRNISRGSRSGRGRSAGLRRRPATPDRRPSPAGETLLDAPGAKPRKRLNDPEHRSQKALIAWARLTQVPPPSRDFSRRHDLGGGSLDFSPGDKIADHIFAIPNGARVRPSIALRLRAEGMRSGVWDLFLPLARLGYHGLWIETKSDSGTLSPEQLKFGRRVSLAGYATVVYRENWQEAADCIVSYLLGDELRFNAARERSACKPSSKKSST